MGCHIPQPRFLSANQPNFQLLSKNWRCSIVAKCEAEVTTLSFLPFQFCNLYNYMWYQVYLVQTHNHWSRGALLPNDSPNLFIEMLRTIHSIHFQIWKNGALFPFEFLPRSECQTLVWSKQYLFLDLLTRGCFSSCIGVHTCNSRKETSA